MSRYTRSKIYYSESVDGTQTGTTLVTETTETEEDFQPLEAYAHVVSEENVVTGAVVSIGTNDPHYNNIVNGKSIGGALGIVPLQVQLNLPRIAPGTEIKVKVTAACIGVPLTTPTLDFIAFVSGIDLPTV
jgi:hypothetical protein